MLMVEGLQGGREEADRFQRVKQDSCLFILRMVLAVVRSSLVC